VLTAAGIEHDVELQPSAGHSFINNYSPLYTAIVGSVMAVGYHQDEPEDAWTTMLTFFERHQ
jgi:dienelactone hydrolase